jgi:hypothetical protein
VTNVFRFAVVALLVGATNVPSNFSDGTATKRVIGWCDSFTCGTNGPSVDGLRADFSDPVCPLWGCGTNGPSIDGLRADFSEPICQPWVCGTNGPSVDGLRADFSEPTCPDWGCGMNGPGIDGLRADLDDGRYVAHGHPSAFKPR